MITEIKKQPVADIDAQYVVGTWPPTHLVAGADDIETAYELAWLWYNAALGGDDYPVIGVWFNETAKLIAVIVDAGLYTV